MRPTNLLTHSRVVSPSIDTISRPGYSPPPRLYPVPLRLCSLSRHSLTQASLAMIWQTPPHSLLPRAPSQTNYPSPTLTYVTRPAANSSECGTSREMTLHKVLRYLHPPSPCSYTSISDEAICLNSFQKTSRAAPKTPQFHISWISQGYLHPTHTIKLQPLLDMVYRI